MDRDEAIARGLRVHETQHSMKRRSPWHDYHGRGTYMLTLVVEGRMPLLGKLWGRVDARPGDGDAPKVMLSELGIAIAKERIFRDGHTGDGIRGIEFQGGGFIPDEAVRGG